MFRKNFLHGIIAGVLSSVAGIIYYHIYYFANEADFSKIVNPLNIVSLNISFCLVIGIIHSILTKLFKKNPEFLFNLTISIFTFLLILFPLSITLPFSIKYPELFPGLVIPMLFFPAFSWFTLNPLFDKQKD
jgi:hypothetical protein